MATRTAEQSAEFVRELLKYALEVRGLVRTGLCTLYCLTKQSHRIRWNAQRLFFVSTVGAQDLLTHLSGCPLQGLHVQQISRLVCTVTGTLEIWGSRVHNSAFELVVVVPD